MLDEFNTSDYEQSIKKYPDWKKFSGLFRAETGEVIILT
jgi:hypothetical protein